MYKKQKIISVTQKETFSFGKILKGKLNRNKKIIILTPQNIKNKEKCNS